jgi:phospholipid-binding lipoprotein MlaA
MKPFFRFLFICCLLPALVNAAEQTKTPARVTPSGLLESQDLEFRDPFATDDDKAEASAKIADPLQPMNRAFFHFNDRLYSWVLKPVAKAYKTVAPADFRVSVRLFFQNLRFPIRGANNLFQGKFKRAGVETGRFLINSTVGIAGLFDPAGKEWRLRAYHEDLDQTLGFYGLPMGIYLHWPIFGPSSIRGTIGQLGDNYLYVSPWGYLGTPGLSLAVRSYETVNATSLRLGEYEDFKKAAFDPYLSFRDAYVENRRASIKD